MNLPKTGHRAFASGGNFMLAIAAGIAIGYVATLAIAFRLHFWIFDAHGRPVVEDFAAFWSAGALALRGMAVAAYDPHFERATQLIPIAHGLRDVLEWSYPPVFFLVAVLLAALPYAWAFVGWVSATLALYMGMIAAIAGRRAAAVLACAAPWTMFCMITGQNGLLTAAIVGSILLLLERRPVVSGLLLGLLSYKPQFGLLFPVALLFGEKRTVFLSAAIAASGWIILSCSLFGWDTLGAFFHRLGGTTQTHLLTNTVGWAKLQSLYGLARWLNISNSVAWTLQICLATLCVAAVAKLWRGRHSHNLKCAGLAAMIPIVTPYVFVYDLPVLAVAIAFLFRDKQLDLMEASVIFLTQLCIALVVWHAFPAGVLVSVAIAGLVAKRCWQVEGATRLSIEPGMVTT